jgi:hypothetical protein
MVYVGRTHTATVRSQRTLSFRCSGCGYKARAVVSGQGQASAHSPFMLDERGAERRALSDAQGDALREQLHLLSLATCPRCQRRDEDLVRKHRKKAIAGVSATLVVLPLLGLMIDQITPYHYGLYLFLPVALIAAILIWRTEAALWNEADARVRFVEAEG